MGTIKFHQNFSARLDHIPIMVFEDIEEFFPQENDNMEAVFNNSVNEKIIPKSQDAHFHLLMRVGEYLSYYIRKVLTKN